MTGIPITVRQAITAGAAAIVLLTVWAANAAGLIIGNPTTSVPRGLYYAAAPQRATHVSFCLGPRHRDAEWYGHFCSDDRPDGIRILKRIAERTGDNGLIVEGDGPRALDSRILGPVHHDQVRGWWRPLVQVGRLRQRADHST